MRESRWPPPFTRALKRNLQGLFFLGDGCWMLGVDEVLGGRKLQYAILYWANWANWANKAYRADKANSDQRLIRLIVFYLAN